MDLYEISIINMNDIMAIFDKFI